VSRVDPPEEKSKALDSAGADQAVGRGEVVLSRLEVANWLLRSPLFAPAEFLVPALCILVALNLLGHSLTGEVLLGVAVCVFFLMSFVGALRAFLRVLRGGTRFEVDDQGNLLGPVDEAA
jgi:hypothetical protein